LDEFIVCTLKLEYPLVLKMEAIGLPQRWYFCVELRSVTAERHTTQ